MANVNDYNTYGDLIERLMALRTSPLAVKMLKTENDIPQNALRPKRDKGYHFAQCQAFSLSRFQGKTVAMRKEDNWCWGPLFAYGLIERSMADSYPELQNDIKVLPLLEYGKYIGILSAPLILPILGIGCPPIKTSILSFTNFTDGSLVTTTPSVTLTESHAAFIIPALALPKPTIYILLNFERSIVSPL